MFSLYLPLFLMIGVALAIALLMWTATTFLGPKNPTLEKSTPYESGADSEGAKKIRPSVRFYMVALLFVVFDVEAVFVYPWASLFRELGWEGFVQMMIFLGVLEITLLYAWKKGAFEWAK